jgi:hypothetical protein
MATLFQELKDAVILANRVGQDQGRVVLLARNTDSFYGFQRMISGEIQANGYGEGSTTDLQLALKFEDGWERLSNGIRRAPRFFPGMEEVIPVVEPIRINLERPVEPDEDFFEPFEEDEFDG